MPNNLKPQTIDNNYRGRKLALWIFALVIAIRALQSVMIIFNGHSTVINADGVPLDTYPAGAAQTILATFAVASVSRLIICGIGATVLFCYRRAIPFMFVVLGVLYLGSQLVLYFIPMVRVGTPPGTYMNLALFVLTLVGLALSLWPRPSTSED